MSSAPITITVKLFAHLAKYLPTKAARNEAPLTVSEDTTVGDVIEMLAVPPSECHIVLIDGVYIAPADRQSTRLADGNALAIWPLVAGG